MHFNLTNQFKWFFKCAIYQSYSFNPPIPCTYFTYTLYLHRVQKNNPVVFFCIDHNNKEFNHCMYIRLSVVFMPLLDTFTTNNKTHDSTFNSINDTTCHFNRKNTLIRSVSHVKFSHEWLTSQSKVDKMPVSNEHKSEFNSFRYWIKDVI